MRNSLIRIAVAVIVFCFVTKALSAQAPRPCGNPRIDLIEMQKAENFLRQNKNRPLIVNRMVRVFFHICRNSDRTNAGATPAQIQAEFTQLSADYDPNSLCFANMGTDTIDNTQINTMINPDVPSSAALLNQFLIPGCINIFYQASLANGDGGNSYAIPNTFCSIARGNIGFQRSLSHEIGHCFGLSHTFAANGGPENIDGSNCSTAGDRVCDTPADPWSFNSNPPSACFDTTTFQCVYLGNCMDPKGATNYTPPFNNIMSYWEQTGQPGGCQRTVFTFGQYNRANGFLNTNAGLLATQSSSVITYGPVSINSGVEMRSALFDITTNGNVLLNGTIRASLQGQRVYLKPGFTASPSNGYVIIRPTNCNY
ncbi:MAG: M43 family zinc metalloprotease [Ferruginibacter sp.]